MTAPLNILSIEDSEDDLLLVLLEFKKYGIETRVTRVETQETLAEALLQTSWDLILCDYSMPHFDGITSLHMIRQIYPDLPVIFLSGTVGEDIAVDAMKAGATDYVMKNNLKRLIPAVKRELQDAAARIARKQAEEKLLRITERFSIATNAIHLGVWELDLKTHELVWDEQMYQLYGLNKQRDLPPPQLHAEEAAKWVHQGEEKYETELPVTWPDGSVHILKEYAQISRDEQGHPLRITGINFDITESKKNEVRLIQAEKLDSLGTLAGGIAHDLNNLLAGLFGYIELAKQHCLDQQCNGVLECLTKSIDMFDMAKHLANQLLTFSKGGCPCKTLAELRPILEKNILFALSDDLKVAPLFQINDDLWPCPIDVGQIGQVLSNIALNAAHAMPEGGILRITAKNICVPQTTQQHLPIGHYVCLSLTDNGIGIEHEKLAHIFDPFFTTKTHGRGLGLAICYSIIKKHGGLIEVESEVGKGTTFHIYLPASPQASPCSLPLSTPSEALESRPNKLAGRIIVMDDEEYIRDFLREALQFHGYEVAEAVDGQEVLALMNETSPNHKAYDAIILDLTIPGGMGGLETITEIRKFNQKILAFVSSGFSEDPIVSEPQKYGFNHSLAKPYSLDELLLLLQQSLSPTP